MSLYVVSYDISKDKLRNKIAKLLEGYGIRMQYSVFECKLSEDKFLELYQKIAGLSGEFNNDSVRFYKLCKNCESEIRNIGVVGKEREVIEEETIVV